MSLSSVPVDAVFMWVDASDPVWLARKNDLQQKLFGQINTVEANQLARFRDNGELRYALRSLARFAPWIRKVHLVTDNQKPAWLNTERVNLVSHEDIFPAEINLPVFNTRPIQFCIHRVPDLAEHFLLFEDDFMLGRPVAVKDFFAAEGRPHVWIAKRSTKRIASLLLKKKHDTTHDETVANSHRLIRKEFGSSYPGTVRHFPKAITRSTAEELWKLFPDVIEKTLKSPFRSFDDGIMNTLYPLYLIAANKGNIRKINGISQVADILTRGILHIGGSLGDDNLDYKMRLIRFLKPRTFCLNDAPKATEESKQKLLNFLNSLFPEPSFFEIEPVVPDRNRQK